MRKLLLAIGLVLMLAGVFVLNQGVQSVVPFAELLGLVSHVQTERLLVSPTLLTVAASSYSFLPADLKGGVQVMGSLEVGGEQTSRAAWFSPNRSLSPTTSRSGLKPRAPITSSSITLTQPDE
jgi:hypothetical protein